MVKSFLCSKTSYQYPRIALLLSCCNLQAVKKEKGICCTFHGCTWSTTETETLDGGGMWWHCCHMLGASNSCFLIMLPHVDMFNNTLPQQDLTGSCSTCPGIYGTKNSDGPHVDQIHRAEAFRWARASNLFWRRSTDARQKWVMTFKAAAFPTAAAVGHDH